MSVDRNDGQGGIDGGRILVALGGALLFASLFIDWYGFGRGPDADGFTAWTAFELVDLILALLAVAAIVGVLEPLVRADARMPGAVAAVAGPTALLLVLVSIVNEPPAAQGFNSDLEVGAWLGLAGAAIMCAGALLALNRVSVVVTRRESRDVRGTNPVTPRPPDPQAPEPSHETETQPLAPER